MPTTPDGSSVHVRPCLGDGNRPALCLEHRCAHPVELVWQAITDSAQISTWFGFPVELDPVPGGRFAITFSPELVEEGRIRAIEPPTLLVYTGNDDVYCWELADDAGGCRITLTNTLGDPDHAPYSAAGFHRALWALDDLISQRSGRPRRAGPPSFDDLVTRYTDVLRG